MERLSPSFSWGPSSLTHCYSLKKLCMRTSRNVQSLRLCPSRKSFRLRKLRPGGPGRGVRSWRPASLVTLLTCMAGESRQDDNLSSNTDPAPGGWVGAKGTSPSGGHLKHTTWVPYTVALPARDCHSHCHFMGTGNRTTNRQINSPALGASTLVGGEYKINMLEIGAFWKNKAGERGRK